MLRSLARLCFLALLVPACSSKSVVDRTVPNAQVGRLSLTWEEARAAVQSQYVDRYAEGQLLGQPAPPRYLDSAEELPDSGADREVSIALAEIVAACRERTPSADGAASLSPRLSPIVRVGDHEYAAVLDFGFPGAATSYLLSIRCVSDGVVRVGRYNWSTSYEIE